MSQQEEWDQQVQDIQDILAKLKKSVAADQTRMAALEQMARDYYHWIEQGIAEGDKTLTAEEYRQWSRNMDAMQQRAKALLDGLE